VVVDGFAHVQWPDWLVKQKKIKVMVPTGSAGILPAG
jgi:hypothetical protein